MLYDDLNLITSSFISVLLGLGIDFGVYLYQRYAEEQRSGKEDASAMRSALLLAGPGVATEAVTTVLAFMTIATLYALVLLIWEYGRRSPIGIIAFVLLALAIVLIVEAVRTNPLRAAVNERTEEVERNPPA